MTVSIPARPDEACPRCGAMNPNARQVSVWQTATPLGPQFSCDNCGKAWGKKA